MISVLNDNEIQSNEFSKTSAEEVKRNYLEDLLLTNAFLGSLISYKFFWAYTLVSSFDLIHADCRAFTRT